jgi:hypothetical protein
MCSNFLWKLTKTVFEQTQQHVGSAFFTAFLAAFFTGNSLTVVLEPISLYQDHQNLGSQRSGRGK